MGPSGRHPHGPPKESRHAMRDKGHRKTNGSLRGGNLLDWTTDLEAIRAEFSALMLLLAMPVMETIYIHRRVRKEKTMKLLGIVNHSRSPCGLVGWGAGFRLTVDEGRRTYSLSYKIIGSCGRRTIIRPHHDLLQFRWSFSKTRKQAPQNFKSR